MALNLEKLVFEVDTSQLETAAKKLEALGTALTKVNKPVTDAALKAEKLAQAQAKTAEATAKEQLATVKLDAATEKLNRTRETTNETTKRSLSIQERQATILEFMNQGYSKGQSSVLAYAKAAGEATDEIAKILDMQRKIAGGDPFDKSLSGIKSLKNELEVLTQVEKLYAQGADLTTKQVRNLSLDRERLVQKMRQEGASIIEIQAALKNLNAEYISVATQVNKVSSAEAKMIKSKKDAATATQYLADTDARLAAALSESNKALDKQATDGLVKYEKALRTSGMAADEAAAKLAVAKKQFEAIGDKKQADRLQYLARAISVQMGDVGISLASGMNPLLVMIQQGDQIRGAIQQAGASGKELEKAMSNAAGQIAKSFAQTGKAIGGFFVNAVKSAGQAVLGLPFEIGRAGFMALTVGAESAAVSFERLKVAAIAFSKVGIITIVAALAVLGKMMYDALQTQQELSVALATTGSGMRMNRAEALDYAKSLSTSGKSASEYTEVIIAMAKAGFKAGDNFKLIANSAIEMHKYAGKPIAETVKAFEDLADKPVEGIAKLVKESRNVSQESVKLVNDLVRQGKMTEAAAVAMKEMAKVNSDATKQITADAGYLERVWMDIITNIGKGWKKLKDLILGWGTEDTLQAQLAAKQKALSTFNMGDSRRDPAIRKQLQDQIEGLQEQIRLQGKSNTLKEESARRAAGEVEWQALLNKHVAKESEIKRDLAEIERAGLKAGKSAVEIQKLKNEYLSKQPKGPAVTVEASKDLSIIQKDFKEQLKLAEGFAKDERAILKARFDAGLIDRAEYTSKDVALLQQSEQKQLDVIDKFGAKYEAAFGAQGKLIGLALGRTTDPENRKKLQEDLDNLVKDFLEFNATLGDTKTALASAFNARELQTLFAYQKAIKENNDAYDTLTRTQADYVENKKIEAELQDRLANAYGAEAASIKAAAEEQKRWTVEITKFNKARDDAFKEYQTVQADPNSQGTEALRLAAEKYISAMHNADKVVADARVAVQNASTDAIVKYYKDEFERINNAITDAIITALFEGGKAGSKKIRDLIIAELKKPITIAVKAVVDVASAATNKLVNTGLNYLGSIAMGSSTVGQTLTAFGQGLAEGAGFTTTAVSSIEAGSTAASAFNAGASAMEMAAAAGPYVLAAVAALNALGVFRSTKTVGGGLTGTLGEGNVESYDLTRKSGTLFNGPSYNVANQRVTTESAALESAFTAIKTSTAAMAESLGLSTEKVKNFTMAVGDVKVHPDIDQLGLVLDGLSNEDKVKKIEELLTKSSNAMAELVLGAGATAEQLVQVYNNVMGERYGLETQLLELQGDTTELRKRERAQLHESNRALYDQIKALEDLKNTTIEVKDGVIEVAEGVKIAVEDISDAMKSLLRERADLEIQLLQVQGKSGEAATAMRNLAIQGFTEAEIAAYDYNQSLKTQIKSYTDAQEAAAKAQADSKAAAQALVEITRSATDAAFNALKTYIESSITEFEKTYTITDIALSRVEKAIEAEKSLAQVRLDSALDQKEAIQAVVDVLTNSIDQLRGSTSLLSARGLITSAISSGNLPEASKLSEAIATVRDSIETTSYATKVDQIKASLRFANELEALQAIAEPQLSAAEQTVVLAQKQIDVLDSQLKNAQLQVDILRNVDTTILSVDSAIAQLQTAVGAELLAREQIDALKAQLTIATEQYNELRNLNTNIISLAAAISGFQSAIISEKSAAAAASVPVTSASNNQNLSIGVGDSPAVAAAKVLYQSATGGVDTNLYNQYVTGAAGQEVKNAFAGDPENLRRIYGFADGGMYPGGLALVGEEGPELINFNQGGQVYNAGQTSSLLNSGDAVEELKAVRQEIVMLRAEVRADVSYNAKTARLLTRVTPDGDTLAVSAAIDGGVL